MSILSDIMKILNKDNDNFISKTFYSNHPFVIAKKDDFDKISAIIEKYRHISKYSDSLMNMKEKILVCVRNDMEFLGLYMGRVVWTNRELLMSDEKSFFKNLCHEYIHYRQDLLLKDFSPEIYKKWRADAQNTIQDYYISMITEADAYTKEDLIFDNNITPADIDNTFLNNLKSLISKVNCYYFEYADAFNFTKIKMKPIFYHKDFMKIIKQVLLSGTDADNGKFPRYTFSFSDISKILDEAIFENKKFEMLAKVNHWSEDETRMRVLPNPNGSYYENDEKTWKLQLDKLCETSSSNKKMAKFLSTFPKSR